MASTSGAPKISLSLGAKKPKVQPRPQLGKRPRSVLLDEHDDEETFTRPQTITGFENGASIGIDDKQKQGQRIITALKNRDFGAEARRKRQRSGLPVEAKGQIADLTEGPNEGEPKRYGLILNGNNQDDVQAKKVPSQDSETSAEASKTKTDDELAIDALLGNKSSAARVIAISEDDAYREDIGQAPDAPDEAAYAAMPVEDFGKALLAGMGWKEGQAVGRRNRGKAEEKPRELQRRPEQLGLGAREDAALRAESGADRKARMKGVQNVYNPVVMRNKATGETLTEGELKTRQEQQKLELRNGYDERKDSRNGDYDRRRGDRDRRKDEDRDVKSGRHHRHRDEREQKSRYDEEYDDYSKQRSSKRDGSSSREIKYQRHHRKERSTSREDKHRRHGRSDKERDQRK